MRSYSMNHKGLLHLIQICNTLDPEDRRRQHSYHFLKLIGIDSMISSKGVLSDVIIMLMFSIISMI